ncbi:MAG: molybdopterin-dependent oxidoreductase [Actinomycetota bacterium]|nr:molybdopterin-dependent oxidoreductase [Actinomycetota bacterium]
MIDTDDAHGVRRARLPAHPGAAGVLAAILALGVSELLAGVLGAPSLIVEVGDLVIDSAPPASEDLAIDIFGTYDKLALIVGIVAVAAAVGAWLGRAAQHRFWVAVLGFGVFAALGVLAAARDPRAPAALVLLTAAMSAAAGAGALFYLLRSRSPAEPVGPTDWRRTRRAFLGRGAVVAVAAAGAAAGGRALIGRGRAAEGGPQQVVLPKPDDRVPPPSPGAHPDVEGLVPVITPNDRFYRIDTALVVPRVDPTGWRLRVGGMVDAPFELSLEELLALPMVERYVTLACVSNLVGGDLVGNAAWLGVPLSELLERAGVQEGATQVVGRSVDRFTVGFPTQAAFDGREALVTVGMNGEPLPTQHGFPARLVVSGLYGYVSATKWLSEIELTTWEAFDAYWVPRGWAKEAPIKTQSRIDVPRPSSTLAPGPQAVAGVAWAPNLGISRVEVQVDQGPWEEAQLAEALSEDTWRQWVHEWEATPGEHLIRVRATDGTGQTQTAEPTPPRPDGATGYHTIRVGVGEA